MLEPSERIFRAQLPTCDGFELGCVGLVTPASLITDGFQPQWRSKAAAWIKGARLCCGSSTKPEGVEKKKVSGECYSPEKQRNVVLASVFLRWADGSIWRSPYRQESHGQHLGLGTDPFCNWKCTQKILKFQVLTQKSRVTDQANFFFFLINLVPLRKHSAYPQIPGGAGAQRACSSRGRSNPSASHSRWEKHPGCPPTSPGSSPALCLSSNWWLNRCRASWGKFQSWFRNRD